MMGVIGYGYNNFGMMGTGGAYGLLCAITWLVVIVDLVLVGVWLWKQINK